MPRFRKAKRQAQHMVKQRQAFGQARHGRGSESRIHSVGTARNYQQALTRVAQWLAQHKMGDLTTINVSSAMRYLTLRGQSVKQKTLDQERQALQLLLQTKLSVIKSELTQTLASRAYTVEQVEYIQQSQTPVYRLATQLAFACGLRAHELLTLQSLDEQPVSTHRNWSTQRFLGREGKSYTVVGKGGLIREVCVPEELVESLEELKCHPPVRVTDRQIHYQIHYAVGGGKAWSNSFSAASTRCLGWSNGAHGLRHSYAQTRMAELQGLGLLYRAALGIVSQEMGHFRPDITEVYLR
jgi:integrase